jgi:hypothetical protein
MVPLPPLETARSTVDQGIATITLDRPEKLNAYTIPISIDLGCGNSSIDRQFGSADIGGLRRGQK